jgi:hypothetical protein
MGNSHARFVHHYTHTPECDTYTYTRSNKWGAVESRHTVAAANQPVRSMITFSDGHGYATTFHRRGPDADNFEDYGRGGPRDRFYEGDYHHLDELRGHLW